MGDNIIISSTQQQVGTSAANLSLVKLGTMTQTILGVVITSVVIAATVATVIMVGTGVGYQPPIANPDHVTMYKTETMQIFPLRNDKDPKGAKLQITKVTQPSFGSVQINEDRASVSYRPNALFAGTDTFKYTISNDKLSSSSYVNVTVLNRAPECVDFEFQVSRNSENNAYALLDIQQDGMGIVDVDSDELFMFDVSALSSNSGGTVSIDNKTLYYTPAHGFSDEEFVTYWVTDRFGTCNGTVTFKLINDAPVAMPDTYRLRKNLVHVLNLLANDYDVNGDKINITYVGYSRAITQLTNNDTALIYTALPSTEPYYDSLEYQISDFELASSSFATIELYNIPPVVYDQTVTIVKNTKNNLIAIEFGDEDEMDTVTIRFSKPALGEIRVVEGSGTKQVVYNNETYFDVKYNEYDLYYTPEQGQDQDVVIGLTADDGYDKSTGQIRIIIQNTAPVAVDDTADCSRNNEVEIDVIANDSDPNGDDVVIDLDGTITTAKGGTVTKVSDKKVRYKAPAGYVGTDSFGYTARDVTETPSKSLTHTAKVTVNVFNEAPVAKDDLATVVKKKTVAVNVLENDTDPNNDELTIASIGAVAPAGAGTATMTSDQKRIQFTATSVVGVVSFPYTIQDDKGLTSTATVYITVTNTAPVVANLAETVYWNRTVTIDAVAKCSDADGDALTILSLTQPANGAVSVSNNKIVFVPLNGFVGTTSFTYIVTDGQDSSAAGTVTVNVKNDAPRVTADTATVHWRSSQGVDIDVLANDVDEDALVVSSVGTPSSGTVSIVTLGSGRSGVRFVPSATTIAPVTFTYRASDWNKETEGTVTVTLTNSKPVPANDEYTFHWRQDTLSFNVLTNDMDSDNDPFTIASVTSLSPSSVGQLTSKNDATGDIVFKLTATQQSQLVPVTFQYSIKDVEESTTKATVKITPTNKNTPQTTDMTKTVHWRSLLGSNYVEFAPYSSITDADGDSLKLTVTQPQVGSAVLYEPSGAPSTVRFYAPTPSNGWKGTASFKYQLSDGPSTSEATLTVTSNNQAPVVAPISIDLDRRYIKPGLTIDVIAQTTDADSADVPFLTLTSVTKQGNANGTCTVVNDKLYYKTEAGRIGTDKFTFTVTDGLDTTTGTLEITNTYEGVSADSQYYEFHWRDIQSGVTLNLTEKLEGDYSLSLKAVQQAPTHGSVTITSDEKRVVYTPTPLYVGVDSFIMSYSDGTLNSTIEVTVEMTNNGPTVAVLRFEQHWALLKNSDYGGFDVLSTANDPDSDPIELVSAQLVDSQDGALTIDSVNGKVIFTLNAPNGEGMYSVKSTGGVQFQFVISDRIRTFTQTATLVITNTAPTPQPLSDSIHWDLSSGKLFSVLQGSTDANSDPIRLLRADSLSPSNSGLSLQVQDGQVKVQGKAPASVLGQQITFIYYVTDDYGVSSQVVTLTVTNQKPVAKNPSQRVHWRETSVALLVAEASGDSDTITVTGVTSNLGSVSGRVTWSGATITYNPPSNLVEEKLTFTITDGIETASGVATVSVYNTAPVAKSYTGGSHWRTVTSFTFSAKGDAHDDDILDASQLTVSSTFEGALADDSVTVSSSGVITVTPGETSRRSGTLSIKYSITDGKTPTYATIALTFSNTAPVASNKQFYVDRVYGTTSYTVTLMDTAQDSDGDPITISYLSGAQYVPSSSSDIYVAVDNTNFVGNKQVQFAYSDSVVQSNIATATITFRNTKPSCPDAEIILNKGETKSVTIQCTDVNGDPVTVSLTNSAPSGLTQSGNTFTFTAPSGQAVKYQLPFTGKDTVGESSATATLTIRVQSQLPVVNDCKWSLLARRDRNVDTFGYVAASGAYDPDGDTLKFALPASPEPVCTDNQGQVVSNVRFELNDANDLVITRPYTFSTGTCTLYVKATDLDDDSTTGKVTVTVYTQALTGVGRSITVDHQEGTFFTMSDSDIMINEKDALGGTLKFIEFYQQSDDCDNPDAGFCNTPPTNPSPGYYRFSQTSDECQTRRYRYRFQSNQDTNQVATAILDVRFQKCTCVKPLDIVFVFDGSGSVGTTNFKNMAKFAKDIITPLDIGTGATQTMVGVVVFDSTIRLQQALSGDRQTLNNLFDTMSLPGGSTNIRSGVLRGEELLKASPRDTSVPKMIITIFDGEPNLPCSCSACRSAPSIGSEANCKSDRYPSRTCSDCSSSNPLKCNPCGDVLSETMRINAKKPGNPEGYWRVMSIGVGPFLSNKSAKDLIADMSYDANLALAVDWDQLDTVVATIQSQSCDLVDTSTPRNVFKESSNIKLYCGQIIGIGSSTNYLYATSTSLYMSSEDFNQAGNRANLFQITACGSYGTVLTTSSTFGLWSLETKKYVVESSGVLLANSDVPTSVLFKFSTSNSLITWAYLRLVTTGGKYPVASTTKVTLTTSSSSGTQFFIRGLAYSQIQDRGDLSTDTAVPAGSEDMDGAP